MLLFNFSWKIKILAKIDHRIKTRNFLFDGSQIPGLPGFSRITNTLGLHNVGILTERLEAECSKQSAMETLLKSNIIIKSAVSEVSVWVNWIFIEICTLDINAHGCTRIEPALLSSAAGLKQSAQTTRP